MCVLESTRGQRSGFQFNFQLVARMTLDMPHNLSQRAFFMCDVGAKDLLTTVLMEWVGD